MEKDLQVKYIQNQRRSRRVNNGNSYIAYRNYHIGSISFISNYVRGKLREKATFLWGILAIAMILSGAVPVLSGWSKRFNDVIYIAPFVIIIVFVCIMFYITKEISVLRRKNQELAMHVSLLNQENERILKELTSITGKDKSEL